jgi:hypothetical protein
VDAGLAHRVVASINGAIEDPGALRELLDPGVEIDTGRSVRTGPDAAVAWAANTYDHLRRRYTVREVAERDGVLVATGTVDYVWTEGGEVADSTPILLELGFSGGLLTTLRVID